MPARPGQATAPSVDRRAGQGSWLGPCSIVLLITQNAAHAILLRASRVVDGPLYHGSVAIVIAEGIKLLLSIAAVALEHRTWARTHPPGGRARFDPERGDAQPVALGGSERHRGDPADRVGVDKAGPGSSLHSNTDMNDDDDDDGSRVVGPRSRRPPTVAEVMRSSTPMAIPALCFTLQAVLYIIGATHLSALIFQVSQQLKIITTALFSVLIMRIRLNAVQWLSLPTLAVGVVMSSMQRASPGAAAPGSAGSLVTGLTANTAACVLSGFASVYTEKFLKQPGTVVGDRLWARNAQLSFYGMVFGVAYALAFDNRAIVDGGVMQGFGGHAWSIVAMQALSGFAVALVIKYADNIIKTFATAFSSLLTAGLAYALFGDVPSEVAVGGAGFIFLSIGMYNGGVSRALKHAMKRVRLRRKGLPTTTGAAGRK
ncbi:unnamed protein product [Pedinophyceae sp. YPF-701]|nr:unnamed protein product [Pedinophyceae sp. YPF-701]